MAASWTGLQIATLAVDALNPVTVAAPGVVLARTSRRIEQVQWASQTVVTRRPDIFAQLGPEAWAEGMHPEIPETEVLDNPYTYTEWDAGSAQWKGTAGSDPSA